MPKNFIKAEKAIAKAIKKGAIPKYFYKGGVKIKSNPYALARKATGFKGSTWHIGMIHPIHKHKRPTGVFHTSDARRAFY